MRTNESSPAARSVTVECESVLGMWRTTDEGRLLRQDMYLGGDAIRNVTFTLEPQAAKAVWVVVDMGAGDIKIVGYTDQHVECSLRNTTKRPSTVPEDVWEAAEREYYIHGG